MARRCSAEISMGTLLPMLCLRNKESSNQSRPPPGPQCCVTTPACHHPATMSSCRTESCYWDRSSVTRIKHTLLQPARHHYTTEPASLPIHGLSISSFGKTLWDPRKLRLLKASREAGSTTESSQHEYLPPGLKRHRC